MRTVDKVHYEPEGTPLEQFISLIQSVHNTMFRVRTNMLIYWLVYFTYFFVIT